MMDWLLKLKRKKKHKATKTKRIRQEYTTFGHFGGDGVGQMTWRMVKSRWTFRLQREII